MANNGSSGNGTTGHLGGELFKAMTGVDIVHVPYKGSAQAINDLIGGQIEVMFDNVPSIGPHVKAGRVRGLGVSAPKRAASFPDIPTIAEAGVPGYETNSWGGIIGPARLPREVVQRLCIPRSKPRWPYRRWWSAIGPSTATSTAARPRNSSRSCAARRLSGRT